MNFFTNLTFNIFITLLTAFGLFISTFIFGDPDEKIDIIQDTIYKGFEGQEKNLKRLEKKIDCPTTIKAIDTSFHDANRSYRTARSKEDPEKIARGEKKFSNVRKKYSEIPKESCSPKQIKHIQGMITATYFTVGEHRDGLRFLCEQYKYRPKRDYKFRHQMHAHIRNIKVKRGFEEVKKTITDLQESIKYNCKRDDLNNIWAAIPLELMRRLEKSATEVNVGCSNLQEIKNYKCLKKEDILYLESIIKNEPENPFLDYAYYTLGDYNKVLNNFPKSYIYDSALLAEAERLYNEKNNKEALKKVDKYLKIYPNGPRINYVSKLKGKILLNLGQSDQAITFAKQSKYINKKFLLDHELYSEKGDNIIKDFNEANFDGVYEKISEIINIFEEEQNLSEKYVNKRIRKLNNISQFFQKTQLYNINNLYKIASTFRECGNKRNRDPYEKTKIEICDNIIAIFGYRISFHEASANIFKTIYENSNDSKSLFLAALAYKRNMKFENYVESISYFIVNNINSEYIDDAYAELGWYYLIIKNDYLKAENNFMKVIRDYPDSNAYDNALNWLIILYNNQGIYLKALEYSFLLSKNIISERLLKKIDFRFNEIKNNAFEIQRSEDFKIGIIDNYYGIYGDSKKNISVEVYKQDGIFMNKNFKIGSNLNSFCPMMEYTNNCNDNKFYLPIESVKQFLYDIKHLKNENINFISLNFIPPDTYKGEYIMIDVHDFGI